MKNFLHIAMLLFISASIVSCSSDDDTTTISTLTVNGAEFKLGDNSGANTLNIIKSKSDYSIWLSIAENNADGRKISIYAVHEAGTANGTYALSNDLIEAGVAVPVLYDADDNQIAGGSDESQPTGTITIKQQSGNRYTLTFNDVVLDAGTASQTNINGTCSKTFKLATGI